MPRPGEIVPRAPADAGHGATAALQRLDQAVPARVGQEQPQRPPGRPPEMPPDPQEDVNTDLNGGYDAALFGASDRPDEPITHGAPFGPGANWVPKPSEDDFTFKLRIADDLESGPLSDSLRTYIAKIRQGV